MLKINYQAEALQQVHTGADEKNGTVTMLRRERRKLKEPIEYQSRFDSVEERRIAIVSLIYSVYSAIDKNLKSKNYGFYAAFASKVLTATHVRTKEQFFTRLCESCGIRALPDEYGKAVIPILSKFGDGELLQVIRDEHQYLMLMLRLLVQGQVLESEPDDAPVMFAKHFEDIPYVSGNSVRGLIRRLAMADYFTRIGVIGKEELDWDVYHILMSGGNIVKEKHPIFQKISSILKKAFDITLAAGQYSIEAKEKLTYICPVLGVLGAALGNITIRGKVLVGGLRPKCLEHGNGSESYMELIDTTFISRQNDYGDSIGATLVNGMDTYQMKTETEVFNTGTLFDGDFVLTTQDPLLVSAFWHIIGLWKDFGYIGGNSARGYGKIDIGIDVPDGANGLYLGHLEAVKEEAQSFFQNNLKNN